MDENLKIEIEKIKEELEKHYGFGKKFIPLSIAQETIERYGERLYLAGYNAAAKDNLPK